MSSVKKNFSLNFIYQLLNIGVSLITTPYIARALGAENSGLYSYSYAIANYFLLFAMLGINNYGNRCIAFVRDDRKERSETFSELYTVQILFSTITILVYIIYIAFLCDYKVIACFQLIYLMSAMFDINWFFFGMEKFSLTVTRNVVIKLLVTVGIFIFVRDKTDVYLYTLLMAASQFLNTVVLHFLLKKYVDFKLVRFSTLKKHIKPLFVMFIPVLAVSIYNIMDKVMLGYMNTKEAVGYYEYSERIMQIPNAFITAAGTVMLPRMAHMSKSQGIDATKKYIVKSLDVVMFFAVAMAFGIAGVADDLIPFFLGKEYSACIILVKALSPIIIMKAWANVIRTQYLIPYCKDKIYVISVSLGAGLNFAVNAMLIPVYGAIGAVAGTIVAELTVMMYQTFKVRQDFKFRENIKTTVSYFVCGLLMFALVQFIHTQNQNGILALILEVGLGGCFYLLCSALMNIQKLRRIQHGAKDF